MVPSPDSFAAALAFERGCVAVGPGVLAVPLFRGRGRLARPQQFTLISADDRPLADHFWSLAGGGYARRRIDRNNSEQLHRAVAGCVPGDGLTVDHINRDKLDNRRENLRVCTQAQNTQNQGSSSGSSRFRGVALRRGRWMAYGSIGGRMHYLGEFDVEEDAARAAADWRRVNLTHATD